MSKILLAFICALCLLSQSTGSTYVKAQDIRFEAPIDALSFSIVKSIVQDKTGYLWIGTTQGLYRYDGLGLIRFQFNPDAENGLTNNAITALCATKSGSLWIGTNGGGLNQFDPATGQFLSFTHDSSGLVNDHVRAIIEDELGNLWIGTKGGLARMDVTTGELSFYLNVPNVGSSIVDNNILSICRDNEGGIWIGTSKGLDLFNEQGNNFIHYLFPQGQVTVRSIAAASDGGIWIGTDKGLYHLNIITGNFRHYYHDPLKPSSLVSDLILSVFEDQNNKLWIGTRGGLDQMVDSIFKHFNSNPYTQSLSNDIINSIFEDFSGIVWFGTNLGINKYDRKTSAFSLFQNIPDDPKSISGNQVYTLVQTGDQFIVGTNVGLNLFNIETGGFSGFSQIGQDVRSIIDANDNKYWVATQNGLFVVDNFGSILNTFHYDPNTPSGLNSNIMFSLCQDEAGDIWIGSDEGVNKIDTETFQITQKFPDVIWGLVFYILYDSHKMLWLGTEHGLYQYDYRDESLTEYFHNDQNYSSLGSNFILYIYEDSDGSLWIGTNGGGLNKFDRSTHTFTRYLIEDGLPSNVIFSVIEDDDNILWVGTDTGLSRFDPTTLSFTNYDEANGLQQKFTGAAIKTAAGRLYLGGKNGLSAFLPSEIITNTLIPRVVITSFTLKDENPDIAWIKPSKITLDHNQNSFNLSFVALDFTAPQKNEYAFSLEGFDRGWTYVDASQRFTTYTNLPPGRYVFKVIAANNDGVWNQDGDSLEIYIRPPFWQSWWFVSLVVLAGAGSVLGFIRFRLATLAAQKRHLEQLVAQRTTELAVQYDKERDAHARLEKEIQQRTEFTRSLVHEIKTPLTPILAASDALANNIIDEPWHSLARSVETGASDLSRRIGELFDLTKGEIGAFVVNKQRISLNPLLDSVYRLLAPEAAQRNLELKRQYPEDMVPIFADEDRIRQVLLNLIGNSFKFTSPGGLITLRAAQTPNEVQIEVEDTGCGIPETNLHLLFEPSRRLSSISNRSGGLGLGLALSKMIIEKHHGRIWVTSQLDKGSTFIFTLPIKDGGG